MFSSTDDFPDDWEPTTTCFVVRDQYVSYSMFMPYNLWKVQRVVANSIEDQVLELVHHSKQILSQCCHICVLCVCSESFAICSSQLVPGGELWT